MAFFQVKTGWKRPRKREYKNYCSVSFQPDAKYKIQKKNSKKIQRFKKYHYGFSSTQKKFEKDSKERIKIFITFRSNPTSNTKFQKNSKKIQKNKKYRYVFFSSQNRFEKDEKR